MPDPFVDRRMERLEEKAAGLEREVRSIAPAATHIAQIEVQYTWIKESLQRIEEKRLDPLHVRLRRVEYAVVALVLAIGSPKVGGPSLPQVASSFQGLFT